MVCSRGESLTTHRNHDCRLRPNHSSTKSQAQCDGRPRGSGQRLTDLARLHPMANKDRATNPPPEKPGGEGWLVSPEQQLLCQFKPDSATVHAQWVAVRTYRWVPPRPPVPQTRRRMLRHDAVEAWDKMLKTEFCCCSALVG